jgi:hypothetical protein
VSDPYSLGGIEGVPHYLHNYSTLFTFGLTGNIAVTYLGSYNLEYEITQVDRLTGAAQVEFHIWNHSTMGSLSHFPIFGYFDIWDEYIATPLNKYFSDGPMSRTTQHFNWTETVVFDPCGCDKGGKE